MNETMEYDDSKTLEYEILLLLVNELVRNGSLDEAETLLREEMRRGLLSLPILDLAARVAVLKGEFGRAGQYWTAILDQDPGNECASQALSCMNGPWVARAVLKRIAGLVCVALGGLFFVMGVLTVAARFVPDNGSKRPLSWNRPSRTAGNTPESGGKRIHEKISQPEMSVPEKKPLIEENVPIRSFPYLTVKDARITVADNQMKIVFDEGLFAYRDVLSDSAEQSLGELGKTLKECAQGFFILVEGHADSDAIPPGSLFKSNYELGLYRAAAALEVLVESGVPENSIAACSTGEKDPPFPNDSRENKQRNRTVVIRLIQPVNSDKTQQ